MTETKLTIGLVDKDTEKQEISTETGKKIIAECLINKFDIFAFTMYECNGVYKMASTGNIVYEPSIRVEIVTEKPLENINDIITYLKVRLNQESIMLETSEKDIIFA